MRRTANDLSHPASSAFFSAGNRLYSGMDDRLYSVRHFFWAHVCLLSRKKTRDSLTGDWSLRTFTALAVHLVSDLFQLPTFFPGSDRSRPDSYYVDLSFSRLYTAQLSLGSCASALYSLVLFFSDSEFLHFTSKRLKILQI